MPPAGWSDLCHPSCPCSEGDVKSALAQRTNKATLAAVLLHAKRHLVASPEALISSKHVRRLLCRLLLGVLKAQFY